MIRRKLSQSQQERRCSRDPRALSFHYKTSETVDSKNLKFPKESHDGGRESLNTGTGHGMGGKACLSEKDFT